MVRRVMVPAGESQESGAGDGQVLGRLARQRAPRGAGEGLQETEGEGAAAGHPRLADDGASSPAVVRTGG